MAEGPPPVVTAPPLPALNSADATFNQNAAALQHSLETTLSGDARTLGNLETSNAYNVALIGKQEPQQYEALRNKANTEGLLHSGILNQRNEREGEKFAQQRYKLSTQEREGREKYGLETQQAINKREEGLGKEGLAALERGKKEPAAPQPIPASYQAAYEQYPGATEAVAKAFPGGIAEQRAWIKAHSRAGGGPVQAGRSYVVGERGPERFVPQQNGRILPNARKAAIRKVMGRG